MNLVHVVPGWIEGKWHIKQLSEAFTPDFALTDEPEKANVIVAHSAGCYSLPKTSSAELIVLIDPPYWPGQSLFNRIIKQAVIDALTQIRRYGPRVWIRLRFWNFLYAAIKPGEHVKVWRSIRKTLDISEQGNNVILIRNSNDAYCGPQIKEFVKKYHGVRFVELPGQHEDCWVYPDQYVKLIKNGIKPKKQ